MTSTRIGGRATPAVVWRVRLVTGCVLLTAMAFLQAGGRTVPDTKLDLTLDPAGFLARALRVWDPDGHLGQLQNQAYGYLFPMGPFHLLARWAQVPEWVTQRAWWSLVLCVAFLGFWRLAGAMRVGTGWARYLGAFVFAISPRFLGEISVTSIEVWPMAMAPWVLLPLVDPAPARLRRRILRSALAFACIGGVNAVATGAALVLPTLWWLTRRPLRRALPGLVAWLAACVVAAAWWLGPLVVLGRYSPPFLDWIESAATTTQTASPFSALQGTTAWLAYLRVGDRPTWPAAWSMVDTPAMIAVSTLPAVIGLAGLSMRGLREGTLWRLGAAAGLVLLTLGFAGPSAGPFAGLVRDLLDGPLAAVRNIHKFELVVRIPLMMGFVHAVQVWGAADRRHADRPGWVPKELVATLAGLLVVAAAAPGVAGVLPRAGGYEQIAQYWRDAARWLDDQPGEGAVAVVPASPFADLTWGSPRDEPFQALLHRPFAVRDAVPLGTAGTTRLLDEVERQLRTGTPSSGLRTMLTSNGIRYLAVRNDLRAGARTAPTLAVHQALAQAGIRRVASFGPPTGSTFETADTTVDEKTLLPYPAVEIYDAGSVRAASLVPVEGLRAVTGGPEDLAALPAGPTVVAGDRRALPSGTRLPEVLTDGYQRREVVFGKASDNRSPVLTADDPGTVERRVKDYVVDPTATPTVLRWEGVESVSASSSTADAGALWHPTSGTWVGAALDGDPSTAWVSGDFGRSVGQWFEVRLTRRQDLTGAKVVFGAPQRGSALPTEVDVTTDAGTVAMPVLMTPLDAGRTRYTLPLPAGETSRIRLTLRAVGDGVSHGFAITQLTLPNVDPVARLVLPSTPSGTPDVISLRRQESGRDGCLRQGDRPLCALGSVEPREEGGGLFREVPTGERADYTWQGTVRVRDTDAARALLDRPGAMRADASSTRVASLANRPGAAIDRDLGTGWVAGVGDLRPSLVLTLPETRTVTGLVLRTDPYLAASRPRQVQVRADDGVNRDLVVDGSGRLSFTARTRTLTLVFGTTDEVRSVDAATRLVETLPVGVSEVEVQGADDSRVATDRSARLSSTCGAGPTWSVDGRAVPTRVVGTIGDVLDDRPLGWRPCESQTSLRLEAARHAVDAPPNGPYLPASLLLTRSDRPVDAAPVVTIGRTGDGYRVPARKAPSVLALTHNANAGWTARDSNGESLAPVRIDGRRQGFVLPAGPETTVTTSFAPERTYGVALAVGFLGMLLVALGALLPERLVGGSAPGRLAGRPLRPLTRAGAIGTGVAGVALVVAFGATGLVAVAAAATWWLVARWWWLADGWDVVPALALAVGAVALVAADPWGSGGGAALRSPWVQALVVAAFAVATVRLPRPQGVPTDDPEEAADLQG